MHDGQARNPSLTSEMWWSVWLVPKAHRDQEGAFLGWLTSHSVDPLRADGPTLDAQYTAFKAALGLP